VISYPVAFIAGAIVGWRLPEFVAAYRGARKGGATAKAAALLALLYAVGIGGSVQ
jgi:hypothetical protein